MMPSRTANGRYHGLDLIRLLSFFAISTFHVSLVHYGTPAIAVADQSIIIKVCEQTARILAFSGFTILFLTSMLTAYSGISVKKRIGLLSFLLVGSFLFTALMRTDLLLAWDIYPLIIAGLLSASLVEAFRPKNLPILGLIGYVVLFVPFWELRLAMPIPRIGAVVLGFGDCAKDNVAEWPVLPWIGLIWFGYWIGASLRNLGPEGRRARLTISGREAAIWGVLLAASVPQLGAYYNIRLGKYFACDAYQQPPLVWWSHFIWPLWAMRLSFDPRLQDWMGRTKACRWVSQLAISRCFWLAYFSNYMLSHLISYLAVLSGVEATPLHVPTATFVAVALLPMTEATTRLLLRLLLALRERFGTHPSNKSSTHLGDAPEPMSH